MEVSLKIKKIELPYNLVLSWAGIQAEWNQNLDDLSFHIHSNIVHKSQGMQRT